MPVSEIRAMSDLVGDGHERGGVAGVALQEHSGDGAEGEDEPER